ncbi:MAG: sulfopyruvate decarboxylase subunit alpha [Candidatus Hodarchaeota archaeon]
MNVSEEIIAKLKTADIDFFATYPCAKIQSLLMLTHSHFQSLGVTKEEEGVGICAGAALAGAKPAMLIQSTGLGNMINALCSLTLTYRLPLLIMVSWRGVYQEIIPAQTPLGQSLPKILKAIGATFYVIEKRSNLTRLDKAIKETYSRNSLQVVLFSPQLWEKEEFPDVRQENFLSTNSAPNLAPVSVERKLTRYEILQSLAPFLEKKVVISNIGYPSRELYQVKPQPSNFYMLGSLGLASAIGLGGSVFTKREVVVIDGDGSLLSNLGVLASIAQLAPPNLTIVAIDNSAHGSTGNQTTPTAGTVDLGLTAKGLGIEKVFRFSDRKELEALPSVIGEGPTFLHVIARAGNAKVPPIPLSPTVIKQIFMEELQK